MYPTLVSSGSLLSHFDYICMEYQFVSIGPNAYWNYAGRTSNDRIFYLYYRPLLGNFSNAPYAFADWCIGQVLGDDDKCLAIASSNGRPCPEDVTVWYYYYDHVFEPDLTARITCS